ncbi:hypothetical protein DWB68_14515 [Galactobacter valiniphilus]|uniref:Uncharacterized protein n=1 Tax=Galactobacter valiniphilus TaxID=2676122 RepID=A0A399J6K3_9MICC|nr:hypothetical protein [Galactobacter valiniphilus]RII41103.1 hypothetical protein DWB68_14515 [Galactobacter valiniphilus]
MAQQNTPQRGWQQSIRPALIISLIMGVVAGVVVSVASVGGTRNGLNLQLGGIAFLIAFVVGLLVISLLMMVVKENPSELGRGSGVQRSSERSDEDLERLEAAERGEGQPEPVADPAAASAEALDDAAGSAQAPDVAAADTADKPQAAETQGEEQAKA